MNKQDKNYMDKRFELVEKKIEYMKTEIDLLHIRISKDPFARLVKCPVCSYSFETTCLEKFTCNKCGKKSDVNKNLIKKVVKNEEGNKGDKK